MRSLYALLTTLAVTLFTSAQAQVWTRDPSFAPALHYDVSSVATSTYWPVADGRVFVWGNHTHLNNGTMASPKLAFLKSDGSPDGSFVSAVAMAETIYAAVPLKDGRVLALRGNASTGPLPYLVRYLATGAPDSTYTPIKCPYSIKLTPTADGRVLLWGPWVELNGVAQAKVVLLATDGTIDRTFDAKIASDIADVAAVAMGADGKVVVSGKLPYQYDLGERSRIFRLNADGSLDASFAARDISRTPYQALAVASDGKVIAGTMPDWWLPTTTVLIGSATANQAATGKLVRFTATGADDATFTSGITNLQQVLRVAVRTDGSVVVQATAGTGTGPWPSSVYVLSTTGAVLRDLRTVVGVDQTVSLATVQPDNSLFVAHGVPVATSWPFVTPLSVSATTNSTTPANPAGPGSTSDTNAPVGSAAQASTTVIMPVLPTITPRNPKLAHVAAIGAPSTDVDPGLITRNPGSVMYSRTDASGRLIISGYFTDVDGTPRKGLARFTAAGVLDPTFVPNLGDTTVLNLLLVGPDGGMIVGTNALGTANANGVYSTTNKPVRVSADGTLDTAFAPPTTSVSQLSWHAIGADGRVLVSYFTPDNSSEANFRLAWLGSDGQPATILSTRFAGLDTIVAIATGGVIETGTTNSSTVATTSAGAATTLTLPVAGTPIVPPALTVEPTSIVFTPGFSFSAGFANPLRFAQPLANGQLLVGGGFKKVNTIDRPTLARLNADGALDISYAPYLSGFNGMVFPYLDRKGRVVVTSQNWYLGQTRFTSIRLLADGRRDPGYYALPVYPPSAAAVLQQDNGLPDLNFPTKVTNADGTTTQISAPIVGADGTAWTSYPFGRYTATDVASITVPPSDQTVVAGRDAVFLVGLGSRHTATFQWSFEGNAIEGATLPFLWLKGVTPAQAGHYSVHVTVDGLVSAPSAAALTVSGGTGRIVNFSARASVSNTTPIIAGFSLAGDGAPRQWLIRAMGPTLVNFGLSTALPDPELGLFSAGTEILHDIGSAHKQPAMELAAKVGAFPASNFFMLPPDMKQESAIVATLEPGNYTARITSMMNRTGPALLEVYDSVSEGASGGIKNLALRSQTGTGAAASTVGFVVSGNSPIQVLIRGVGPALSLFGITGAVVDPQLALYRAYSRDPVVTNSGWDNDASIADAAKRVGAFTLGSGSRDAAVLVRLEPGAYTVQLTSASGASGEALAEVYVVP